MNKVDQSIRLVDQEWVKVDSLDWSLIRLDWSWEIMNSSNFCFI